VVRRAPRRRIGLLGGSFNPAHEGHLAISRAALKRLRLDRVWWLVSPQNPLKPADQTTDLEQRLAAARAIADHPRVVVTDLERRIGTRYTVDTVGWLSKRCRARFVWLIGADNMAQLPRWRRWRSLARARCGRCTCWPRSAPPPGPSTARPARRSFRPRCRASISPTRSA